MKTYLTSALVTIAAIAGTIGTASASSVQPYIWTSGELGLIANPAYKATPAAVDKTTGILIVGVGENGATVNPAFAKLSDSKPAPLFQVGVGEYSLVEIKPAAKLMASK